MIEITVRRALIYTVILLVGMVGFVYVHEEIHVLINERYGMESRVEWWRNFPDVVTYANDECPTPECVLAHHLNEIVSYPLMAIYTVIALMLQATWFFSIADKQRKEEEKIYEVFS